MEPGGAQAGQVCSQEGTKAQDHMGVGARVLHISHLLPPWWRSRVPIPAAQVTGDGPGLMWAAAPHEPQCRQSRLKPLSTPDLRRTAQDTEARCLKARSLKGAGLAVGSLVLTQSGVVAATNTVSQRTNTHAGPVRSGEVKVTQKLLATPVSGSAGITATTVCGRVVKLTVTPVIPSNRGKTCARGQAGVMELYDQDRLKTPLIRTGERGVLRGVCSQRADRGHRHSFWMCARSKRPRGYDRRTRGPLWWSLSRRRVIPPSSRAGIWTRLSECGS